MILPLLSLGLEVEFNNTLYKIVGEAFSTFNLPLTFRTAVIFFVVAFAIKVILELLISLYTNTARLAIEQDFRSEVLRGLKDASWPYLTGLRQGLVANLITQEAKSAANHLR